MELLLGIFSSVCSTVLVTLVPKILKAIKANNEATLSYLRSRILDKCKEHQAYGYLPDDDAYSLQEMYRNYKALGGNHHVDSQVNKTLELPMVKPED